MAGSGPKNNTDPQVCIAITYIFFVSKNLRRRIERNENRAETKRGRGIAATPMLGPVVNIRPF